MSQDSSRRKTTKTLENFANKLGIKCYMGLRKDWLIDLIEKESDFIKIVAVVMVLRQ